MEPEVDLKELQGFLSGHADDSGPGPSRLVYGHIKHATEEAQLAVCELATASLHGHATWAEGALRSTMAMLRKKAEASLKSYRPVTLQQVMTKIVTGVLAARLAKAIRAAARIYPRRGSGRSARSANAVLEHDCIRLWPRGGDKEAIYAGGDYTADGCRTNGGGHDRRVQSRGIQCQISGPAD